MEPAGRSRDSGDPFVRAPRSGPRASVVAAVAAGGAVGGVARYAVDETWPPAADGFPWATFGVNVSGAFLLGLLLVLALEVWPPTTYVRPFVGIGVLGSFTTFGTWMIETDRLVARGDYWPAVSHVGGSVLAGLAAAVGGMVIGRTLGRRGRA